MAGITRLKLSPRESVHRPVRTRRRIILPKCQQGRSPFAGFRRGGGGRREVGLCTPTPAVSRYSETGPIPVCAQEVRFAEIIFPMAACVLMDANAVSREESVSTPCGRRLKQYFQSRLATGHQTDHSIRTKACSSRRRKRRKCGHGGHSSCRQRSDRRPGDLDSNDPADRPCPECSLTKARNVSTSRLSPPEQTPTARCEQRRF
jgi:hypothetical protein